MSSILLDTMTPTTFTNAQKRWRISCTAIHFTRYLARPEKKIKNYSGTIAQRRWRLAHTVIYSSRAILSLTAEMAVPNSPNSRNHLSPHTVVEIKQIMSNHGFDQTTSRSHLLEVDDDADDSFFPDIDQSKLTQMVKEKDLNELSKFGGTKGLTKALRTHPENGICGGDDDDDFTLRKTKFGTNTYNKLPPKGLLHFVVEAFKDATIIVLLGCAALSLGFGIKEHGGTEGWYEGGSMFIAVFLAVAVSALSNLTLERVFDKLQQISNDIKVDVVRDGRRQEISIFDIMVGDVVFLTTGDQIPADGVFLSGDSFKVDESSMTGESEYVEVNTEQNPFLLSGSKVADGHARMLVTSVGVKTTWGNMMSSSIACDSRKRTSLQALPDGLTSSVGKTGFSVAFLVVLIRYISGSGNTKDEKGNQALDGIRTAVVTLTLAYSLKRMMANHAMVRKLLACETMGSATVICTDKTGMLTVKQMKVTKFWIGQESIEENRSDVIAKNVLELFHQAVGLTTTATVCDPVSGSIPEFSGSPTEKAILSWAILKLGMDIENLKQSSTILHVETFSSENKRSGVSVRKKDDDTIHLHWKGAAEMVLDMCSHYYQGSGNVKPIDEEGRKQFEKIIQGMAASSLRCIAFAHKKVSEQQTVHQKLEEDGMTMLGIVGLKYPCRPGANKAIQDCRAAGVAIKMITGDNLFTAKAIAAECGVLDHYDQQVSDGEVVEGEEFRNYTHDERMEKVNQIRVMARSTPSDKVLMVQCLKRKGHVVVVTGDGTNDAPALKEADIGFSMGIQGSDVAKESSDIIILDDDFASAVAFLRWGRCIHNNMQKFVQFQLPVNVSVLVINFVAAVSAREVPPPTVHLLWVNLIMDSLGALALATEQPTNELMEKPPVGESEPLTTNVMCRNLLAQALYQIAILLTFQFRGRSIFKVNKAVNTTIIFNTFVFCQVFNIFNSRKLEKKNAFNRLFIGIIALIVVLQIVMVEFLNKFADTVRLNWWQWVVCIAVAAVSWPIGWCVNSIPVSEEPILATSDVQTLIGDL